jgi:hypothetical protein
MPETLRPDTEEALADDARALNDEHAAEKPRCPGCGNTDPRVARCMACDRAAWTSTPANRFKGP